MTSGPPELPSIAQDGDERTTLIGFLEYYRAVLIRKTYGLSDDQLATAREPSDLTLGGMVLHMALVEDNWFDRCFMGNDDVEPWASAPWEDDQDWDFHVAAEWSHSELMDQFDESIRRSREAIGSASFLDQMGARPRGDGTAVNLRWILVHMIEEYARHCGHADLIREALDGSTGD